MKVIKRGNNNINVQVGKSWKGKFEALIISKKKSFCSFHQFQLIIIIGPGNLFMAELDNCDPVCRCNISSNRPEVQLVLYNGLRIRSLSIPTETVASIGPGETSAGRRVHVCMQRIG